MQTLLEVQGVTQSYGTPGRVFTALSDINVKLEEGSYTALVGPSGCGKSTLLRIITGLQRPTSGKVLYREQALSGVNPYATIVFQTFALFPWLTVQQNVEVALEARGVAPKARTERALDVLDRVGLDGFETAYPRELSGGMRQKVGFARAMAVEPELLCLDEPFSALDVMSAEAIRGELLELWTGGKIPTKAILMVTHNIEEAVFMSDRILVMDKQPGRVISQLTVVLPHPRERRDPKFLEVVDSVYATMAGTTQAESVEFGAAPGQAGAPRALPAVHAGQLAGFLESIEALPDNKGDLYRLAADLGIDATLLLALTEASELLGFATIARGDVTLTPLGQSFAEASILTRKEIFATRIRRLPMIQWIVSNLRAEDEARVPREIILAGLEMGFSAVEAERQLDTAVDWGRYAEVFAYDDRDEQLFLEAA